VAQFATPDDLAGRLGVELLAGAEFFRADGLLTLASGLIQDEARQKIERVENDVLTIRGTTDERIPLPERPVIEISSVKLDGGAISGWYQDGDELARPKRWQRDPALASSGFGRPRQTLEITYTHGYQEIPGVVVTVCLEMVVRAWVNPGAVAQERVGDVSVYYANVGYQPTGLLMSIDERRAIRKFFGTRARSVRISGGA
jgi:hypothetical protein